MVEKEVEQENKKEEVKKLRMEEGQEQSGITNKGRMERRYEEWKGIKR